jgi:hypothetical protein
MCVFATFLCGCIELNKQSQGQSAFGSGVSVTEHTYLWGDEGFFTKKYDVTITIFGANMYSAQGVSRSQLDRILEEVRGLGNPTSTTTPTPQTVPETGPTITLPASLDVRVDVQKYLTSSGYQIKVAFAGGKDQDLVDKFEERVTLSNGMVSASSSRRPVKIGAGVTMPGTTGTDRVEVTVTINGVAYKIIDKLLPA